MKTTTARYMKNSHGEDSYNLSEEIAVRGVFRTIRPNYLADHFNTAFAELSGDIYAQARLVDIGLRYENNLALNLAAARKIRTLLDEHKILMIPAYIEDSAPEISGIIAAAIPTIRNPDPRRYFLERWMHHKHPEVARICREALIGSSAETATAYAARPELNPEQTAVKPVTLSGELPVVRARGRKIAETDARQNRPVSDDAKANTKKVARHNAKPSNRPAEHTAGHTGAQEKPGLSTEPARASPAAASQPISSEKRSPSSRGKTTTQPDAKAVLRPAERSSTLRKKRLAQPSSTQRTPSAAEADTFGYEKLIGLIDRHIADPKPEIRLKWVKLIGHIPERLDPEDEHKMRFITIGLADPVQDICLEAVAQIEFLIHDRSKLAMLLKVIDSKSPLIRSKEAKAVIDTLAPDGRKLIENRVAAAEQVKRPESGKRMESARGGATAQGTQGADSASPRAKNAPAGEASSETGKPRESVPTTATELPTEKDRSGKKETHPAQADAPPASADMSAEPTAAGSSPAYSPEEKAELTEIVEELDLPAEAIAELERENTPSSILIKEIAPAKTAPHADNYFLRHSAVLHIKNIHEEELRFELYQTVLKHDPKDLVRQIAVEEARNLKREHVRPILRLGLDDPAWQVRSDALEYLLPFLSGTEEEGQILRECARDGDYHIRQKADEKLQSLSRRTAAPG